MGKTTPIDDSKWNGRLKLERVKAGMTTDRLGELTGVSGASITRYEQGKVQPNVGTFMTLCQVLNVDPVSLWFGGDA